MSMKELEICNKSESMEEDDNDWLDEEIQNELSRIDSEELEEDDDKDLESDASNQNDGTDLEEIEPSPYIEQYLSYMQKQAKDLEAELEECDEVLQQAEKVSSRDINTDSYLKELAKEKNVPVDILKEQILEDISKEEEQDNTYIMGMAEEVDAVTKETEGAELPTISSDDNTKPDNAGDETVAAADRNANAADDLAITVATPKVDLTVAVIAEEEKQKDKDEQNEDRQTKDTHLMSGDGVIAEITEADLLEKSLWKQLKSLEEKHKQREDVRNQERSVLKELEQKREAILEERRRTKQEEIKMEQEELRRRQQESEAKLLEDAEEMRKRMQSVMELHQSELDELSAKTQHEKEQFLSNQQQRELELLQRRNHAAIDIQRFYRGYRVRKQFGSEIKSRMEQWRVEREQRRIEEIEKARKAEIEAKEKEKQAERARKEKEAEVQRQKEEMERKRAEEERKKLEEERRRKEEEERKKLEEERRRKAEEKRIREEKLREEEEQKKLWEERQRQEQEERRRAEEERRLKEAKQRQKEEEENKRREEIERKRREAEKARREQERLEREEKERQKCLEEEMLEKAIKEQARQRMIEDEKIQKECEDKIGDNPGDQTISENTAIVEQNSSSSQSIQPVTSNGISQSPIKHPTPTPPKSSGCQATAARRNRQTVPAVRKSRAFLSTLRPPQPWGESLPQDLDQKRISWIKDCTPWSQVLGELRTQRLPVNKKPPRRPVSGKMLPLLEKSVILNAAKVSALQQVTTVELHDLPGCSLRTLAECPQLKSLLIQNCHLVTTDGIQACKALQYVDLQNNQLEVLTCKDLTQLTYLNLSHNSLTSIHGLEGCYKLKYLNVAHNRITRLSGLDHLKSLHTFDVSHNQLISSKGLSVSATIQELNLSSNHLSTIDDLDKLGLLQSLDITRNTLLQVPSLNNQILLLHLSLNENNIANISGICNAWLPMLHTVKLCQNRITSLPNLINLLLLEELDVSNNQILEMAAAIPGLMSLRRLKRLIAVGNPITEEDDWRLVVEDKLPHLEQLDDVMMTQRLPDLPQTKYERMCHDQLHQHLQLKWAYQQALSSAEDFHTRCIIHSKYYTQSYNLATEHRYSHEYGEISAVASLSFEFEVTKPPNAQQLEKSESDATKMKSKFDSTLMTSTNTLSNGHRSERKESNLDVIKSSPTSSSFDSVIEFDSMLMDQGQRVPHPPKKVVTDLKKQSQSEAISMKSKFDALLSKASETKDVPDTQKIPSQSGTVSKETEQCMNPDRLLEKTTVPANTVGEVLKKEGFDIFSSKEHVAATKIQALWRGYILRKRLQNALNYARQEDSEDGDFDLEFGEVDLNDFSFNEDELEKDWLPPETPQLPNNHAVIKHPLEGALCTKPPHPPANPRQVWKGSRSPSGDSDADHPRFTGGKPPLPPLSRLSNHTSDTLTEGAHTYRSKMSKKEEQISEEWGFKDSRTAELMLQRARKLKYNAVKKKKLGQLDPKQRLALFKKLQETTRIRPVVPVKKGTERREYFRAQDEAEKKQEREKYQENQIKEARTYEWLHTQVGHYEVTSSRIQNRESDKIIQPTQPSPANKQLPINLYNNSNSLPRMDPNVLAGGRALLTGSPMSLELQSVDDTSQVTETVRSRRSSLPHTDSAADRFPPIKNGSAPSVRPEKMSWRSPEVNKSSGWGGGKKRGNLNH